MIICTWPFLAFCAIFAQCVNNECEWKKKRQNWNNVRKPEITISQRGIAGRRYSKQRNVYYIFHSCVCFFNCMMAVRWSDVFRPSQNALHWQIVSISFFSSLFVKELFFSHLNNNSRFHWYWMVNKLKD